MIRILTLIVMVLSASTAYTAEVRVGRYSSINPIATPEQQDPLSVVIDVTFPSEVRTVRDALQHILDRSGWNLASGNVADPMLPELLNATLPEIHRHLGPITLREALKTLSGKAWLLVEDPVHRLVSFELDDRYSMQRGVQQ